MKKLIAALSFVFLLPLLSCKDFDDVDTRSYETIPSTIIQNPFESQESQLRDVFYPIISFDNHPLDPEGDYLSSYTNRNSFIGRKNEPKVAWYNNTEFNSRYSQTLFQRWHSVTVGSTQLLRAIRENKISFQSDSEKMRTVALAYFTRAMAYGYLAKTFDQALIVDNGEIVFWDNPQFKPYAEVLAASLSNFDSLFAICQNNQFTVPLRFLPTDGVPYTEARLSRLAHTYAANFLIQSARSFHENTQTNWEKAFTLSKNGLKPNEDFLITLDNVNWDNFAQWESSSSGLGHVLRVDFRVLRWFDPNFYKRYPIGLPRQSVRPSDSLDKRLWEYIDGPINADSFIFNVERWGSYSAFRVKRYDLDYLNRNPIKPSVYLYAETNRLIEAEALAMTGNLSAAIQMINDPNSRRKTIGKVADIPSTSTLDEVLNQIHKERDLELMLTDYALHYADARRFGRLQRGAILHFPVPFTELTNRRLSIYTYGGQTPASIKEQSGTQLDTSRSWLRPSEIR